MTMTYSVMIALILRQIITVYGCSQSAIVISAIITRWNAVFGQGIGVSRYDSIDFDMPRAFLSLYTQSINTDLLAVYESHQPLLTSMVCQWYVQYQDAPFIVIGVSLYLVYHHS